MYIMCVCLFSALSRRVGALQISIIITDAEVLLYVHRNRRTSTSTFTLLLSSEGWTQAHDFLFFFYHRHTPTILRPIHIHT